MFSSIRQSFSWSRLQISEEDLRQLFANQEVHPNFLDIVHIFGEKTEPIDESFSTFFCHPISRTVNLDSFSANDGYGMLIPVLSWLFTQLNILQKLATISNTWQGMAEHSSKILIQSEIPGFTISTTVTARQGSVAAGFSFMHQTL